MGVSNWGLCTPIYGKINMKEQKLRKGENERVKEKKKNRDQKPSLLGMG